MNTLTKIVLPLTLMAAAIAVAQEAPSLQPAPTTASRREAMMARRQVMQRLTTDFRAALQNASFTTDDRQKAEAALAQVQPKTRTKGAAQASVDPKARHEAMKLIQQMSASPAVRNEDRQVLAKDLADLKALGHHKS